MTTRSAKKEEAGGREEHRTKIPKEIPTKIIAKKMLPFSMMFI